MKPSLARRLRPLSRPSPGAAAKTRVRSRGSPVSRKRRSRAAMTASGVPTPTNPEVATVSPCRTIATASSTGTILLLDSDIGLPACSALGLVIGKPVRDAGTEQLLRPPADEDAHMPARERQLGIVLRPDLGAQGLRCRRRGDVVVLCGTV